MKAVLVFDKMPNSCGECIVRCDGYTAKEYAQRTLIKPNWCPLRPLPKEMEHTENEDANSLSFRNGWNSYYFEITGETE